MTRNRIPGARRKRSTALALAVAAVTALTVTACGEDDTESGGGGASGGSAGAFDAQIKKTVDAAYANEGFTPPPADSPAPKRGFKVHLVAFGLESPAGAEFAKGFEEAGAALGWDTTVFDGKFDPNGYQEGINRAIAAKADAVALYVVDCAAVQAPLRRAKKAGLLVVAGESADCDEAGEGEALFDGTSSWKQGDYNEAGRFGAEVQTSWVIKETKGAAKTILFHETDLQITRKQAEEAKRVLAKCQGCEIVQEVKFTAKDFGPALQQKAEQALLRNRDANSIIMPYDDVYLAGVGGAIRASGRKDDDLAVVSGIGQVPAIDAAREGQALDAGYGWVVEAQAYQLMDVLNRLSNDQEPAKESPFSVGLWDKSRLPPKGESWNPAIDYPAEYKRIWAEAGGQ